MLQDVINIELGKIRYVIMKWIYLAQKKDCCEQGNDYSFSVNGGNFLNSRETNTF
jgi:hypothetical protein